MAKNITDFVQSCIDDYKHFVDIDSFPSFDVKPKEMLDKSIFLFSGLRLVLIPLVVYVGCLAFRVDGLVTGVSVLLAAMPAASTTAILAAKYDGDAVYASKCVVLTTVMSLIATPLWSMLLLKGI